MAGQMAAVATIRQGYTRYVIVGSNVKDDTSVIQRAPTSSTTYSSAHSFGNTAYGSSSTVYSGGFTAVRGRHNAQISVFMFNSGDAGYENALDAQTMLGPDWKKKVADGISTCTGD